MDEPANRPLPRLDATVSAHQRRESRPRRRPCLRWGCIALLVLAFLLLAAAIAVRVFIRKDLTPEDLREIRAAETEIIQLSPEWHRPAPTPSPEVLEARKQFNASVDVVREAYQDEMWEAYDDSADLMQTLRRNDPIPPAKQEVLVRFMNDFQPVIQETSNTVSMPGYTFEMGTFSADVISMVNAHNFAKYASIAGLLKAQEGNCTDAMETALLPVRYIKRPEQSFLINHLIAVAVSSISVQTIYALAEQCSDPAALKRGLELMTELRSAAYPGNTAHWRYADSIGALTHAANSGYPVDLKPQTMVSYYRQSSKMFDGTYHQWLVDNLPTDDSRVEAAKQFLAMKKESAVVAEAINENALGSNSMGTLQNSIAKIILGVDPIALFYATAPTSNFDEMEARTSTSLAMYDLTRIHLARRLVELEPDATTITAYLSPVPNDPFTGALLPFSEQLNKHYSPGPDNSDGQAAVQYDATNGTFSNGDVWMEIR